MGEHPRLLCLDLGPGPSIEAVLPLVGDRPGLVALRGRFADGHPLLTSHPLRVIARFPADEAAVSGARVDGVEVLGGGWFGVVGVAAGATRFAWHDHVVRSVAGRWRFEALWTEARAEALTALAAEWRSLIAAAPSPSSASPPSPSASSPATSATVSPRNRPDFGETVADVGGGTVDGWPAPDLDRHLAAVETAIGLIRAGRLYQVNVCTRLAGQAPSDPAAAFARAATDLDPDFGALLPGLLCLSPELFWRRRGRDVVSSPIKGTLPAAPGNAERLRRSGKDIAENVMIVDLVRNDLGRVCEPGSVRPSRLLEVVSRVGVLHLESTVLGRLRPDVGDAQVHAALFPPASVTGTPKVAALGVIDAVEAASRGAFTGAVGFLAPGWGAEFAVVIRSVELHGRHAELGVGGGVTVDSVPMLEWAECLAKARPVLRVLGARVPTSPPAPQPAPVFETILVRDGRPVRLADHLARLGRSTAELSGGSLPEDLAARITAAAGALPAGSIRGSVRVVADPDGDLAITAAPVGPPPVVSDLRTAVRAPGCWRHKWVARGWAVPDTLFVTEDGTVLETERGNIVLIARDGTLVTPPLTDGLLPGVTRRALLDEALGTGRGVELRCFGIEELLGHAAFWTSSLSGAVPIASLDGRPLPRRDDLVAGFARRLLSGGPVAVATPVIVS